jgi:phage-related protein
VPKQQKFLPPTSQPCTIFGTVAKRKPSTKPPSAAVFKRVPAIFYRTDAGGEPVRDWLKALTKHEKRAIGEDIKTVELGWPIGMPVTKPLGDGLHEVRTQLGSNRIARVVFYVDKQQRMVLLHGFVKKTKKMPDEDLELARKNKAKHEKGLK